MSPTNQSKLRAIYFINVGGGVFFGGGEVALRRGSVYDERKGTDLTNLFFDLVLSRKVLLYDQIFFFHLLRFDWFAKKCLIFKKHTM